MHMPHLVTSAPSAELLDQARAVLAEIERADGASPVSDQAMLAVAQGARALFLVTLGGDSGELGDELAGVSVVGEGEVDLAILPAFRTPEFEAATLRLLLEQAPGELRSWVHGERPSTESALAAEGFAPARSLYRMALDPDLLPTDGVRALDLPTPVGLTLRAFGTAPGDDEAWVAANAAAFATHPEQGRITVADFATMREEPWFDREDLILLDAGHELAGSTWVKTLREAGTVACELYAVGVRPTYAGKGLGRLLLQATLARMAEHAPASVTLYVDGDNTAAVGLYESAGFTIDSRSKQWLRPDSSSPNARMDT
ncbi:mycothiol synthase [Leucobacter salsicius]|uniref:mycothiol synthase n=1 Tax=Leucobacter salsicius TaxID=664638 RepID=UPI00034BBA12|nr:mycothiol synthase [Leucobacter salsicius]